MSGASRTTLEWGGSEPLVLEIPEGRLVADLSGPAGVSGGLAREVVATALANPGEVPPLSSHVVPGDRVTIAVSGEVAEEDEIVAAVIGSLGEGGVAESDISLLRSTDFGGADDSRTGYLGADADADPIYLARELIDADAIVTVGEWNWDASLSGRSIEGEIWPAFSRRSVREKLVSRLVRRRHEALEAWRATLTDVSWQLGILACLRVIPGTRGTVAEAVFGSPHGSRSVARKAAAEWRPRVATSAELSIASLHEPRATTESARRDAHGPSSAAAGFERLVRGVAAAARITTPDGTICVASRLEAPPGPVFVRWRQGAPLPSLVREAVDSGNPELVADAFLTLRFSRALGGRRVVLLSGLDQETVEDLEFGHADSPDAIARLSGRAGAVAVLHEADRMLPDIEP